MMLYGPVFYMRRVFIQIDFNYETGSNGILLVVDVDLVQFFIVVVFLLKLSSLGAL